MITVSTITKPKPGIRINRAHPLAQGLAGYWAFNEGSGTKVRDLIGTVDGTLTNFTLSGATSNWAGSIYGGGLKFDGANDHVNFGDNFDITAVGFSVSVTIKFDSLAGDPFIIGKYNDGAGLNVGWYMEAGSTGNLIFLIYGATNGSIQMNRTIPNGSIVVGKTYNILATYDGGTVPEAIKIYLNGTRKDNTSGSSGVFVSPADSSRDLVLGCGFTSTNPSFPANCVIDRLAIWRRYLNVSDAAVLTGNPNALFLQPKIYV